MSAVLVLGAEGFIGRALRARLADRYRLLSVDVRPPTPVEQLADGRAPPVGERRIRCDLGDPRQIDRTFGGLGAELRACAGVVHLASYYDFANRPDPRYDRLHLAMPRLLEWIGDGIPVESPVIYASSMAALAPTRPGRRLRPESPRLGAWMYPRYKREAERVLEGAGLRQPVVELVLAAVYSDWCELVPLYQQIERVARRVLEACFYPGPTDRGLTYLHLDEATEAFDKALEALRGRPGIHRFLVGQHEPVTYREIHERASLAFHGRVLPLRRVPPELARVGARALKGLAALRGRRRFLAPWMVRFAGEHFEFDLTETTEALGWTPSRSLHEDLGPMLDFAATHHDLWRAINERRPW
jgi:nucleoside-diphosphate-sugar epimerase